MDDIEKLKNRITDISTLRYLLLKYLAQRKLPSDVNCIKLDISDISDSAFNLFNFNKMGFRVWMNDSEYGRQRTIYNVIDDAFARECFLSALNMNKSAILQSMIDKMSEEIKADYEEVSTQMHLLSQSMIKKIDKHLCTEEREIVTKVLTNKYAEENNEEMSPAQP